MYWLPNIYYDFHKHCCIDGCLPVLCIISHRGVQPSDIHHCSQFWLFPLSRLLKWTCRWKDISCPGSCHVMNNFYVIVSSTLPPAAWKCCRPPPCPRECYGLRQLLRREAAKSIQFCFTHLWWSARPKYLWCLFGIAVSFSVNFLAILFAVRYLICKVSYV